MVTAALSIAVAIAPGHDDGTSPPDRPYAGKTPQQQRMYDRQWLDWVGSSRIGAQYACAVSRPTSDAPRRVVIYVTGEQGAQRARNVRRHLNRPRDAVIRRTSPRFAAQTRRRIRAHIVDTSPTPVGVGSTRTEGHPCLALSVQLLPPDRTSEELERWAAELVARFGRDRVVIQRIDQLPTPE
jgi:hypothetical protein